MQPRVVRREEDRAAPPTPLKLAIFITELSSLIG
jgi:hypothetical protein